jgi:hypothetical protein
VLKSCYLACYLGDAGTVERPSQNIQPRMFYSCPMAVHAVWKISLSNNTCLFGIDSDCTVGVRIPQNWAA